MEKSFAYHRSVAPMVWAFASLAIIEMLVVHLFLTLRWPVVGWTLFAFSAASLIWLVHWIRSFRQCPHVLANGHLELRTGSLALLKVPLEGIEGVATHWSDGEHKHAGAANVVPLAYPNRMLRLKVPIKTRKGACDRVAFRVDEVAPFDAAMEELGIPVR